MLGDSRGRRRGRVTVGCRLMILVCRGGSRLRFPSKIIRLLIRGERIRGRILIGDLLQLIRKSLGSKKIKKPRE